MIFKIFFLKNQREVCTVKASSIIWAEPYLITAFCYYRPGLFYRDVCYYLINFQPHLSLPIFPIKKTADMALCQIRFQTFRIIVR
jgi:hypothetical protein